MNEHGSVALVQSLWALMQKWRNQARGQDNHAAHHLRVCADDLRARLRVALNDPLGLSAELSDFTTGFQAGIAAAERKLEADYMGQSVNTGTLLCIRALVPLQATALPKSDARAVLGRGEE
jgi:hypothetical protein